MKWYRFEDRQYAPPLDEFDNLLGTGSREVVLIEFEVVKETRTGVRLDTGRFVSRHTIKQYACPTIEEAKKSFLARKNKQIRILTSQLEAAKLALQLVEGARTVQSTVRLAS